MGTLQMADSRQSYHLGSKSNGKQVIEEIHGLLRVYSDGSVDRLPMVPEVPCNWALQLGSDVSASDVAINRATGLSARLYAPAPRSVHLHGNYKMINKTMLLPVVVYFHGGGFCVGSAAWSCYHQFMVRLSSTANCVVISVNYRLAPEHRLPAAYEDGVAVIKWLKHQHQHQAANCSFDFDRVFLAGDSAGATIAYHVATRTCTDQSLMTSLRLRGLILIQPFFGGEGRTASEKTLAQPPQSALSLATSDCYWRLALPVGSSRDHPWCNPLIALALGSSWQHLPPLLVCVSELDILRDRNLEFCKAMERAGKRVHQLSYAAVGHAFQLLHNYALSHLRTTQLLADLKNFLYM